MRAQRSPYKLIKPRRNKPARRTTGAGNNNADAYPQDAIHNPESPLHPDDGQPKRSPK